jgi:hypothetical protein
VKSDEPLSRPPPPDVIAQNDAELRAELANLREKRAERAADLALLQALVADLDAAHHQARATLEETEAFAHARRLQGEAEAHELTERGERDARQWVTMLPLSTDEEREAIEQRMDEIVRRAQSESEEALHRARDQAGTAELRARYRSREIVHAAHERVRLTLQTFVRDQPRQPSVEAPPAPVPVVGIETMVQFERSPLPRVARAPSSRVAASRPWVTDETPRVTADRLETPAASEATLRDSPELRAPPTSAPPAGLHLVLSNWARQLAARAGIEDPMSQRSAWLGVLRVLAVTTGLLGLHYLVWRTVDGTNWSAGPLAVALLVAEWLTFLDLAFVCVLHWSWQPTIAPSWWSFFSSSFAPPSWLGPLRISLGAVTAVVFGLTPVLTLSLGWQPIRTYDDELLWRAIPYLASVQLLALLLRRAIPTGYDLPDRWQLFPIRPAALRHGAFRLVNGGRSLGPETRRPIQSQLISQAFDAVVLLVGVAIAIGLVRVALAQTLDAAPIFVCTIWAAFTLVVLASLISNYEKDPEIYSQPESADDATDEILPESLQAAGLR